MPRFRARPPVGALTAALTLTLALGTAAAAGGPAEGVDTTLVTHAVGGGLPDGPSTRPVISLDQRYARVLAFQSTASNLVSPSPGSTSNVYYIVRQGPYDNNGVRWLPGSIQLASVGLGGQPANGPSGGAAVSGDNFTAPTCVAFVSAASNLVPGDSNGQPDAFVLHLRTRRLERVSLGSHGGQANGAATAVAVDGKCSQVAFVDYATNLARGTPAGVTQVYVRNLARHRTTLASRSRHGAGNANSSQPAFALRRGQLVFTSAAPNLAGPTGGHTQVFERSKSGHLTMLSRAPGGAPGNGDSDQPAIHQYGKAFAFRTRASNLAAGADASSQVVWSRGGSALALAGGTSHGDAADPDIVDLGYYVLFDSLDPSLATPPGDAGAAYLYTDVRHLVIPVSVDTHGQRLRLPGTDPAASEAANYIFFETSDPDAGGTSGVSSQQAAANPAYHQIYLRYLGPK